MGNAQTSCCFRSAWQQGDDPNDARSVKELWPLPVFDIDKQEHILEKYMQGKKCGIIVNVASQ